MTNVAPEPFIDPQGELGIGRPRRRRTFREYVQGRPAEPLDRAAQAAPAQRQDVLDVALEMRNVGAILEELVEVTGGEAITVPRRLALGPTRPSDEFDVEAPDQFHAAKIDNPADANLYVLFASGVPSSRLYDEIVPPRSGRVFVRPYDSCVVGYDPPPAAVVLVPVTFYSRQLQPAAYPLALGPATGGLLADSLMSATTVVGPGANALVGNMGTPPAGVYSLRFLLTVGPGAVAADYGNVRLRRGGATIISGFPYGVEQVIERMTLNGNQQLDLQVINAGTAGVPYSGRLEAQQVE